MARSKEGNHPFRGWSDSSSGLAARCRPAVRVANSTEWGTSGSPRREFGARGTTGRVPGRRYAAARMPEVAPPSETGHAEALAAIIRGMTVALAGSLLGGGFGFLFTVVMARMLHDRADFGLLVLGLNVLNAATSLTVFGTDVATIRYVAAAPTPGAKRGAIATPLGVVLVLNAILSLAVALLAHPLAVHVFGNAHFTNTLRALAVVLPLTVLAQMFSAGLSGLERASGELARKVVEQGGRIVLSPLGLAIGAGIVGAVLGMAAAAGMAAFVVGWLLWRSLPRGGRTEPLGLRRLLGFSWQQTVAGGTVDLWLLLLATLLARETSAAVVGAYGAALAISRLPALIYNAFTFRFSPAIARLWEEGRHDELRELLKGVTRWVSYFAIPLHAVAIALPGPLLLLYGASYRQGALMLAFATTGLLINALAGPVERTLIMSGRVRLEMIGTAVPAVILTGLAFVLIPRYGLTGAAVTILLSSISTNALKSWFVWRTMRMSTVSLSLLGPLAAAAIASGVTVLLAHVTELDGSLPGVAALGLVLLAVYALLLVGVVGVSPRDRQALALAVRPAR
ncbi:MAG: hypothetical protein QOE36_311 [Gaiellaceae bacterium]|nr:hypothetical protein [Gaiellaceae bacterium]